jgi:uncharacterized protein (UPF0264 family)
MQRKQHLLVAVRGPNEAAEAVEGGADLVDVEAASASGTPYPLNIRGVRDRLVEMGRPDVLVSTSIGKVPHSRALASQAALGVAVAGADIVRFGLAEQTLKSASYLATNLIRTVRALAPGPKKLLPVIYVDEDMRRFLRPFEEGPELAVESKADGVVLDVFNERLGVGVLDTCRPDQIAGFAAALHEHGKEPGCPGS